MKEIYFIVLFSIQMFASGQISDLIIINSDTLILFSEPLDQYYEKNNINTDSLFEGFEWSTACWDKHFAVWEIENNVIYLKDIVNPGYYSWINITEDDILYQFKPDSVIKNLDLSKLFKDKFINGRVKADWCNNYIKFVEGSQLEYIHLGFYSLYEKENILEVQNGEIIQWDKYGNDITVDTSKFEIDTFGGLIISLPKSMKHCYFYGKTEKLTDTLCFSNPQETISLFGKAEYFNNQMRQDDQIIGNEIVLDSLVLNKFSSYTFDKYIQTKKKWHNVILTDGWKGDEYVRLFIESKFNSRHWFALLLKGYSKGECLKYSDSILNKMVIGGI